MITSEEIKRKLWNGANDLRGSMDASKYKDYMLGLMFYKFLSDKTLQVFKINFDNRDLEGDNLLKEYERSYEQYGETLEKMMKKILGYYVLPQYLYQRWLQDIREGEFELQKVMDSLNSFERSITVAEDSNDFKGLFSSSIIDLTNTALGSDLNKRSKNIKDLILLFADLNMVELQEGDVLGDAYEYLIGQFASNAGKKAGEFYTPHQVSEVMAQIIAKTTPQVRSIYDPTVGSGSLLLTVSKHLSKDAQKALNYYGQEYITETYNLTRMNLLLHGVRPEKMDIRNGNTLAQDWPEDPEKPNEGVQFDAVVMNPPYSDKRWNKREDKPLKVSDPRFADFGVLPPDNKGDFAYLMHGLYHLGQNGTMAIVLPHGVLFRGAAEGEIRKRLLDKNYIDAIIGLPSNLFTNTGIPVCVLILKKNRDLSDPVLIIDASRNFIKVAKQNVLQEKDIAKIVDVYTNKTEIKGYSHLATRKEIQDNEYNMNIPRYVEAIDTEVPHDVDAHLLGGIPEKNIKDLKILQSLVKDVMTSSLVQIRPNYVELKCSISELTDKILSNEHIRELTADLKGKTEKYIDKYWDILRNVSQQDNIIDLREAMLIEIKELLASYHFIDVYEGYQVIAELWKEFLTHDLEFIKTEGFHKVGRKRIPNLVVKGAGNKKREEQEGWNGVIIPNDLISKYLYVEENEELDRIKFEQDNIENELSELAESAKNEESAENEYLYEILKKNSDDEPQDTFDVKLVKDKLKEVAKQTDEFIIINKVKELLEKKVSLAKELKEKEKTLKESIYERITKLTDKEIDTLVREKWFGDTVEKITSLIEAPIHAELSTLEMLQSRYVNTIDDLDKEISNLEAEFEKMMSDLVVMRDE